MKTQHKSHASQLRVLACTLVLTSGFTTQTFAQNPNPIEQLKQTNALYAEAASYSANIELTMYKNGSQILTESGSVKKSDDAFYSDFMGQTTLMNKNCVVNVDEYNQQIHYAATNSKGSTQQTEFDLTGFLEQLENKEGRVINTMSIYERKQLRLKDNQNLLAANVMWIQVSDNSDPNFKATILAIDKSTNHILKVIYIPHKNAGLAYDLIELTYNDTKLNINIPSSQFSEKQFVLKSRNGIKPNKAYQNYEIIN